MIRIKLRTKFLYEVINKNLMIEEHYRYTYLDIGYKGQICFYLLWKKIIEKLFKKGDKMTDGKKRLLTRKVWEVLRENILNRYNNSEYWDFELDAVADVLSGLDEQDKTEVLRLVDYVVK